MAVLSYSARADMHFPLKMKSLSQLISLELIVWIMVQGEPVLKAKDSIKGAGSVDYYLVVGEYAHSDMGVGELDDIEIETQYGSVSIKEWSNEGFYLVPEQIRRKLMIAVVHACTKFSPEQARIILDQLWVYRHLCVSEALLPLDILPGTSSFKLQGMLMPVYVARRRSNAMTCELILDIRLDFTNGVTEFDCADPIVDLDEDVLVLFADGRAALRVGSLRV